MARTVSAEICRGASVDEFMRSRDSEYVDQARHRGIHAEIDQDIDQGYQQDQS